MEKINIAELLKDCPKGMELDCTMFDNVTFEGLDTDDYPIKIKVNGDNSYMYLTENGCWNKSDNAKCVIFPKGKTTWEGFVPLCKFKDGDIIYIKDKYNQEWCSILSNDVDNKLYTYIDFYINFSILYYNKPNILCEHKYIIEYRLATEEEKQKLFKAIKENGYSWNPETKTLEKLVEPKFKVGDRIVHKNEGNPFTITEITDGCYKGGTRYAILITQQDNFELVPNKFDINSLKPFDKVLVRNKSNEVWTANFYSHYDATSDKPFICVGWSEMNEYRYCIPYEVNNELLGTTNNTEEYGSR